MEEFAHRNYRLLFGLFLGAIVILTFYVGMLYGQQEKGTQVELICSEELLRAQAIQPLEGSPEGGATTASTQEGVGRTTGSGAYLGSKNGTKYYAPGCSSADRIKPENRIWFKDAEDATLQGYTPGSC